jgi:hypothetical protein
LESDIEQVRAAGPQNVDQLLRIASVSQIPQVAEHRGRLLDAETEFAAMQDRYGSLHPKYITASTRIDSLKQALHENVGKAGDILNGQYEAAVQTETKLTTALKEQETAALELNGQDLRVIPQALAICRATTRAIRRNLAFAACYNVVGIALAAAGLLHPIAAALIMLASSMTVTWRVLRETSPEALEKSAPTAGPHRGAEKLEGRTMKEAVFTHERATAPL